MLTRYIRRNCSDPDLTADLRQDVYAAAIEGARRGLPESAGGYVHTIARNLLINRAKRSKLVSYAMLANLEGNPQGEEMYSAERHPAPRGVLPSTQEGTERLPPRRHKAVNTSK